MFFCSSHDAVGIGNAHPAALKGKVKNKWWKIATHLSDIK